MARLISRTNFLALLFAAALVALLVPGPASSTDSASAASAASCKKAKHAKRGHSAKARARAARLRKRCRGATAARKRTGTSTGTSTNTATPTAPGATVATDTASSADPLPLWGKLDCVDSSRQAWIQGGGDGHATASGAAQGNDAFRRLTVFDGDDFWGERCELGRNEQRGGSYGSTFALYREGQHRVTSMSFRLPSNFPLNQVADPRYNVLMQMKQTQPSYSGGGSPMIELDAFRGSWHVEMGSDSDTIWSAPAQSGVWTRFTFDVVYSQNPSVGSITVSADLNGDGDTVDAGEQSGTVRGATLKVEAADPSGSTSDGIAAGESIPSHLRTGIYHDKASTGYSCPAPAGCSVDVDNVQVLNPS